MHLQCEVAAKLRYALRRRIDASVLKNNLAQIILASPAPVKNG
jgi:hypothetical protein